MSAPTNECARKRLTLLMLFPVAAPLEDVAMDLLGELIKTPQGSKHLLMIADRSTKLARVIPDRTTRAIDIARVFYVIGCLFTAHQ